MEYTIRKVTKCQKNVCFKQTITNIFVSIEWIQKEYWCIIWNSLKHLLKTNKNIEEKHRWLIESAENNGLFEYGYYFIKGRKISSNYDYKTKEFICS